MPEFYSVRRSTLVDFNHHVPMVPVSVVIPCYRHNNAIRRAVESVVIQSVRPTELILVNDGGGEEDVKVSLEIQKQYGEDWVAIITLPQNVGAGEARNAGWKLARGTHVAFLDADDAWHPRKIEIQYGYMSAHPEVVVSGHRHRHETFVNQWDDYVLTGHRTEIRLSKLLISNQFITPSAMVRRDLDVRFANRQRHMEDYRLWLTVAIHGDHIVRLEDELACIYKPIYGQSGLSAELLKMELGELKAYLSICLEVPLFYFAMILFFTYSVAKFLIRLFFVTIIRR